MFVLRALVLLAIAWLSTAGPAISAAIRASVNAGKIGRAVKISESIGKVFGIKYRSGMHREWIIIDAKLYKTANAVAGGAPFIAGGVAGAAVGISRGQEPKTEDLEEVTDEAVASSVIDEFMSVASERSVRWEAYSTSRASAEIARASSRSVESANWETGGKIEASKAFVSSEKVRMFTDSLKGAKSVVNSKISALSVLESLSKVTMEPGPGAAKAASAAQSGPPPAEATKVVHTTTSSKLKTGL
jgi:hypothetical protein